jgi:hypothetical protein
MKTTPTNTLLAVLLWRPSLSRISSLARADPSPKKTDRDQNTMRRNTEEKFAQSTSQLEHKDPYDARWHYVGSNFGECCGAAA